MTITAMRNLKLRDETQLNFGTDSRLRLLTIVRLRWLGVLGQIFAVGAVYLVLGFDLPVGACLISIAMSAWVNVYLAVRYPGRHRLSIGFATSLLAYDIVQLASLLYLTGGIDNPFTMLIVAPVTVSAATLPLRQTIMLGILAIAATALLVFSSMPLPWYPPMSLQLPMLYRLGVLAAVCASMPFLALYVWRLTKEGRQMSAALSATELILAREQKLHALDGLAAAAAHELGTPLSTITLVTHELSRQMSKDNPHWDDVILLKEQSIRCREILQKLTRHPPDEDPLHASLTVQEMLHEAAVPYLSGSKAVRIRANPAAGTLGPAARQPVGSRRPGVIYGLGNLIENAVDFAETNVEIDAEWDANSVNVVISDNGPGFKPEVIDALGEPYVTTRPSGMRKTGDVRASGLGLGFFIAKTLLERSGARLSLENHALPLHGAVVRIVWPRYAYEARLPGRSPTEEPPPRPTRDPPPPSGPVSDAI
jgi:two-component system sensor histidine kinase RegB